ncbi:MAG TPA: histone deacetylase, partial [Gemmatimonas sp.]|nr:histone deacetylase [Gemmatimonas sp.]
MLALWSSARYTFPLPDGHRFPVSKYALLRDRVVADGLVGLSQIHDAPAATDDMLLRVHTPEYVSAFRRGALTPAEVRKLGFPWSAELVERSTRALACTVAASRHALEHGVAMNLAGGTHHAFPAYGEGFCVFNDVAVATRTLQHERLVRRVVVIDLDVHQGNGTHAIFTGDGTAYTFSMHGGRNFPFNKVPGTLDIELEDGTADAAYLALLRDALPRVLHEARADMVFYLAGADPHEGDRLGRLALTFDGLRQRDMM